MNMIAEKNNVQHNSKSRDNDVKLCPGIKWKRIPVLNVFVFKSWNNDYVLPACNLQLSKVVRSTGEENSVYSETNLKFEAPVNWEVGGFDVPIYLYIFINAH